MSYNLSENSSQPLALFFADQLLLFVQGSIYCYMDLK